jgi:ArsR family transcriptional regulator, lead/cadmium/zinc/bismuth-responsive transcriptional repressor
VVKKVVSKENIDQCQNADAPKCDEHLVHLESIRASSPKLLPIDKAQEMADIFAVLADANRLRLVSALAAQELCVCDLAALTKMSESAVCHQLRLFKVMRLVKYRREGRNIYYSLGDGTILNLYKALAKDFVEPKV